MGWSLGFDGNWGRDIGYGVPAYCDAPKCMKEIDRGLSYVCGGQPYGGEKGCGLYFCEQHSSWRSLCKRCESSKLPYKKLSPEHPRWISWKLKDKSWKEWRKKHPNEVKNMLKLNTKGVI